ncbi:MAG: sigma-54-dependent Fis family transcriptional regulator [Nannocystis sp.]|uniref:sigma-54-dependent transcriptional regulator n=1 Tax=Nannocystis sp. TaxID=1962667 RepID=UPI0024275A64|nr:sigma-54 dependent transcriptional regulator [Nannocystis sp.]MBK9752383.1 sigma-54-dependent Fis family transcriptional regulator [Nannocystis sp.]
MAKILIVDDEAQVRFTLAEVLTDAGHQVIAASGGAEALRLADDELDAVISDLAMPGMDGLELLAALRQRDASLPVLLLTARGSERVAVQAMKAGAYDYLVKPFDIDEIVHALGRAVEARLLRREQRRRLAERGLDRPIVGDAPALRRVLDMAARIADRELPVLVLGETGTGKELIAGLLHAGSRRARGPLVRFNCAAIPEQLADSELFGHARGAFTGASAARRGYFAQADGGTLVLDEIAELPLAIQAKLLRALQSGEIQPLGARVEKVDVRVVACTHRDLRAEVAAGRFREDLYYRLAVLELRVPPLRERREDIPVLADSFARRYAARFGLESVQLAPELVASLVARPWPGNVRELENCMARLVALSSDGRIGSEALAESATVGPGNLRAQVEAFERGLIEQALRAAGGNHSEAARRLATSRVTLLDKLKKHGLQGV